MLVQPDVWQVFQDSLGEITQFVVVFFTLGILSVIPMGLPIQAICLKQSIFI